MDLNNLYRNCSSKVFAGGDYKGAGFSVKILAHLSTNKSQESEGE